MVRWWYRLAAGLIVISGAFIGLVFLTAADDPAQTWYTAPAGCAFPCWQGIQPGVTTAAQAVSLLNHHPWVGRVWGVSHARWSWSGQQPGWIDADRPGTLSIRYGLVEQIGIPTRLAMGDFWLMYKRLEKGVVFTAGLTSRAYYFADTGEFWVFSDLRCPITVGAFWRAPVQIILGDMSEFERQNAGHYTDYTLPGWHRSISC